jgi:hypothetical protein
VRVLSARDTSGPESWRDRASRDIARSIARSQRRFAASRLQCGLGMRTRSILALSLFAATAIPSTAHAWSFWDYEWWYEPPPPCAVPGTAQCLDPAYRSTDCGRQHESTCQPIVHTRAEQYWQTSPAPIEPVLRPPQLSSPGTMTEARVSHFDTSTIVSDAPPAAGFLSHRSLVGLQAIDATTSTTRQPVSSGYRWLPLPSLTVSSCADYVHKKWFGYQIFEQNALACGNDPECVYQVAVAPGGLSSSLIQWRPGFPSMTRRITELEHRDHDDQLYLPKNDFFHFDWRQAVLHSGQWHASPFEWWTGTYNPQVVADQQALAEMLAAVETGTGDFVTMHGYRPNSLLGWHREMHDAWSPLELTFDEQAANTDRQTAFTAARGAYDRAIDAVGRAGLAVNPDGSFRVASPYSTATEAERTYAMASYNLAVNQLTGLLLLEWRHRDPRTGEIDHGCLGGISCDWSPQKFSAAYVGLWQGERAQDMERCNRITGGSFAGIPYEEQVLYINGNGEATTRTVAGGTTDIGAFESWMKATAYARDVQARGMPFRPPASTGAPRDRYRTLRWAIDPIDQEYGVPGLLYAKYEQKGVVELGAAARVENNTTQLCSLNAGAYGKLYALMQWPTSSGIQTHEFIDALVRAGVGRDRMESETSPVTNDRNLLIDFDGHLKIDGKSIFNATLQVANDQRLAKTGPEKFGRFYKNKVYPFSILGIPAYAEIAVEGQPSYEAVFQLNPRRDGSACGGTGGITQEITNTVSATLTGKMDLSAIARLGVGIPGASIGVKGTIDVLHAEVPATARVGFVAEGTNVKLKFATDGHLFGRLLAGSISFFAELLWMKDEWVLYRWAGLPLNAKLWEFETTLPIVDLASLFTEPAQ